MYKVKKLLRKLSISLALDTLRDKVDTINGSKWDLDLEYSLDYIFERFRKFSVIDINFNMDVDKELLTSEQKCTIFSIIRESLSNAVYHGKADRLDIDLYLNNNRKEIIINIKDNGKGCDTIYESYGLIGLREKVKKLDGEISFDLAIDSGFVVNAKLPIIISAN